MCHVDPHRHRDNFRLPTLEEFWVVPLQQAAIIENHAASHSQHHDALEVNGVTAVLPFSFSRLNVLPILCAVWHGPVSAALYVPVMDGSVHLAQHLLHGASLDEVKQHVHDIVTGLLGTAVIDSPTTMYIDDTQAGALCA